MKPPAGHRGVDGQPAGRGALGLLTTAQAAAGEVRRRCRDDLVAMVGEVRGRRREGGRHRGFFDAIPTGMKSSMQRDAESGRRLELDAIGGAVVRAAGRHHIEVPLKGTTARPSRTPVASTSRTGADRRQPGQA